MKVKRIDFLWICILIIVFLFSMAGLNVIERWNDTIIRNVNIEENKISKKSYTFNIDDVVYNNGDIMITLWFLDHPKPNKIKEYVVLENTETKESIIIPTEVYQRQDIVDLYGDEAYLYCGIKARVSNKYIDTNADYNIYILNKNDKKNTFISLDTTVKGWKPSNEE